MSEYIYKTDNELPAPYPGEMEMFIDNIELIISHVDTIISRKELFYTELSFGHISTTLTGTEVLPIGVLVLLWRNREFLASCSVCGGKVYIVCAAGSPLSGSHQYTGICPVCKKVVYGSKRTFRELYGPVHEIAKIYPNYTLIKKTVSHYFSPGGESKEGITENVVREKIHGFTLDELINELKRI